MRRRPVLPVPPVVSQLQALLPDGKVDPAAYTDCGWACLGAALQGMRGVSISPGCFREAAGLPDDNGVSTGHNIEWMAWGVGLHSQATIFGRDQEWQELGTLRRHGQYALILGGWLSPSVGHWVLAYERGGAGLSVMEPFHGEHALYTERFVSSRRWGAQVWLRLK